MTVVCKMLSSVYLLLTLLWGFCYGFVLLSSPAGAGKVFDQHFFPAGNAWNYNFRSSVLLNEKGGSDQKSVGFFIEGELLIKSIWANGFKKLLEFQLVNPRLHIRSRKSPDAKGFSVHSSKLDEYQSNSFFIEWDNGKIERILLSQNEPLSNFKKGIASTFQFQPGINETNETDASGACLVKYKWVDAHVFTKVKDGCFSLDLPLINNPQRLLETIVVSSRSSHYTLDDSNGYLLKISSTEKHTLYTTINADVGGELETEQVLTLKETQTCQIVPGNTLQEAIAQIGDDITNEPLTTQFLYTHEDQKQFINAINSFREFLQPKSLGTVQSAKAFVNLVRLARRSSKEDIAKALASKKNQPILHQLYDILGFVQTSESHEAVMKKLHFEKSNHEDFSERYLWALAICSHPNPDVVQDLLQKYRKLVNIPKKVKETMILTIASMAYRLGHQSKVHSIVEEAIVNELATANNEERACLLRALKNLRSPSTLSILLDIVKKGTLKEGASAWRAIVAQNSSHFDENLYKAAYKTFYQLDKKYDSSARALAADVLLESNPSKDTLKHLLEHLKSTDKAFEIKQYVLQRIGMLADENDEFDKKVKNIIKNDQTLNNYNILGQKGLSTALRRNFLKGPWINGSLLSVQEMNGGIVKKGVVNVAISKDRVVQEIFSLGIFSGGLNSFLSSDSDNDVEDETATAGMELTVLGNQIRPFIFFSGQGELMGHVWSGTASERTTAFQALALLQDHHQFLRLTNGFIVEIDVKGAVSFDLAGSIQLSLWNRNGDALVEKAAGILLSGLMNIETGFIRTYLDLSASLEPKLQLNADIDFSSEVMLCMRLQQPDTLFRYNTHLIERVLDGSKHKFRIAKYRKSVIPGKTYALNRKNSNMCNAIFK